MPLYTFRTEGPFDGEKERAEALIAELKLTIRRHWKEPDAVNDRWLFDMYTVESDIEDIEELRAKMDELIVNDDRFMNLHRCAQTLDNGPWPKDPSDPVTPKEPNN